MEYMDNVMPKRDHEEYWIPDNSMTEFNIKDSVRRMQPGDIIYVPGQWADYTRRLVRTVYKNHTEYHVESK